MYQHIYYVFALTCFRLVLFKFLFYRTTDNDGQAELFLGKLERSSFVTVLLKLIDRGQYSKNEHLSETVAAATSILSYVEPSLVLPFLASRFHLALETVSNVLWVFFFTAKNIEILIDEWLFKLAKGYLSRKYSCLIE